MCIYSTPMWNIEIEEGTYIYLKWNKLTDVETKLVVTNAKRKCGWGKIGGLGLRETKDVYNK